MRSFVLLSLRVVLSLVLFVGTGELALRFVFRDAGRTTSRGPGGQEFEHLATHGRQRGRLDNGPKRPDVPRILVLGDSITWGQGVRDWRHLWPELVATSLERTGTPHEMAVIALPGNDILDHARELERAAPGVQPDVLIYQWYVNDIEVRPHRPENQRWWQRLSTHRALRRASYLYYLLDYRLSAWLPMPGRSYVDYILQDFKPGSFAWAEFARHFHTLATRGKEVADERLLILYPFRGAYPLPAIHERLHQMAGAHRVLIPPAAWIVAAGTPGPSRHAHVDQHVLQVPAAVSGLVFRTRAYYAAPGDNHLTVTFAEDSGAATNRRIGTAEIVDVATNNRIGEAPIVARAGVKGWQEAPVRFSVPGKIGRAVRYRLLATGGSTFSLASLHLPVNYGFKVVDLTEPLSAVPTHASIFDAHPSAAAHRVIADEVLGALTAMD